MKPPEKLIWGFIPLKIDKSQAEGSGLAMILISLLAGYYTNHEVYYKLAIPIVLIVMTVPRIFYPFAVVWFSISNLLGSIMPKIIMTGIYFVILLPVAVFRRLRGYDPLLMRRWKKGTGSVMGERNHLFTKADLQKPY